MSVVYHNLTDSGRITDTGSFPLRQPELPVAVGGKEKIVVADDLLNDLSETGAIRAVDNGMDALLKCLHGVQCLKGIADENYSGVPSLVHCHRLKALQTGIGRQAAATECFFYKHNLVLGLGESEQKVIVIGRCVDFVAKGG